MKKDEESNLCYLVQDIIVVFHLGSFQKQNGQFGITAKMFIPVSGPSPHRLLCKTLLCQCPLRVLCTCSSASFPDERLSLESREILKLPQIKLLRVVLIGLISKFIQLHMQVLALISITHTQFHSFGFTHPNLTSIL